MDAVAPDASLPLAFSFQLEGPLTRMERLSVESCLTVGYRYKLYAYGNGQEFGIIPQPAQYADAREILPTRECRPDRDGSYTNFRLRFMFSALYQHGGVWIDTDYVLVRKFPQNDFLALDTEHGIRPIFLRLPAGSSLALLCATIAEDAMRNKTAAYPEICEALKANWPEHIGARLLTPAEGCPFDADESDLVINPTEFVPIAHPEVFGVKCWRAVWDKEDTRPCTKFPLDSLFERLWWELFGAAPEARRSVP